MNKIDAIISLTSHTKERLKNVGYFLYHSVLKYNYNVKVVLTLYKDDIPNIPDDLKLLITSNSVELITADVNLTCHLKYFYTMQKYKDIPIITIDDDSIYPRYMIPDLLAEYKNNHNIILCRNARVITPNESYKNWFDCMPGIKTVTHTQYTGKILNNLSPAGYAGVLYPPHCFELSDNNITEIMDFLRADDIYLTILEQRNNIPVKVVKYNYSKLDNCTKGFDAISTKKDNIQMIDALIKKYKSEFI